MECLDGENWITVIENLGEEVNRKLRKEVGKIQKQLTVITNDTFGLLGDSEHQFTMLYDFAYYLISNVLNDAEQRNVFIGVSKDEILNCLEKDKIYFVSVKTPTLVHWDTIGKIDQKVALFLCVQKDHSCLDRNSGLALPSPGAVFSPEASRRALTSSSTNSQTGGSSHLS